ncbi:DUF305 domain-containing protein [Micromonospora sp. WMMD882]|uniref:DUF305 domain-containing protein n=1 Tax=Micromonospora sp. WMMD882 TaxID=3015151 RepID=UPI00248AD9CE|nr:DUF305 domain-containing protein [Micromonospora sp. WMMD882]WBB79450.1 DUF305 domain-containing protein [Micromonospora sp. WMMD882]
MTAPTTTQTTPGATTAAGAGGPTGGAGRRRGTLALAVAVVVGLLLGYAGGLLTPRLTRPGDASAEAGFARDMTTHHAQAVEMGLIAFDQGADGEVRQIGGDIATGQQGEIGMMQAWLRSWDLDPTGSQPRMSWMPDGTKMMRDGLMPGMATPDEMARLREARGTEGDILFLDMMIDHHIGGVHMIDAVLEHGGDPEVLRTAQVMKNTQQKDLNNLRAARDRLRG